MRRLLLLSLLACAAFADSREARAGEIFKAYTRPGVPGCAAGVLENGKTALAKGYGLASLEHNIPVTPATRFYMASVPKQFTSLAALIAEQEGKLKLDDSVRKYVPELPAWAGGVTLRRMLDHTAGLRDYLALWSLKGFSNESVLREGPTLSLVARQKALDFEPGADYSYSNTGYFLMALVIERATGRNLGDYTREKILAPLGMDATHFQHDHSVPVPDRAHGYRETPAGYRTAGVNFDLAGSGGLYSNIDDMLKWARNFEEPKVGAGLLEVLQTPGRLNDGRETPGGYALGLSRARRGGLTVISHGGGAPGYATYFLRIPERRLSVTVMCVGTNRAAAHAEALAGVFLGENLPAPPRPPAPPGAKPQPLTTADRKLLAGEYWSEELAAIWRIYEAGGRLVVQSDGAETSAVRLDYGSYRAGPARIRVPAPIGGRALSFTVDTGRAKGIEFTRRPERSGVQ
jgi:CubicO group peptidase (beta-lactamase class C family)